MIEVAQRTTLRVRGERSESTLLAFLRRLDWILLCTALGLVGYGIWVVAGITRFDVPGDESYYVTRQAIAAGLGFAGLVVAAAIPLEWIRPRWQLIYGATLALMVIVFVAAETVRGSKRWIDFGLIQFQPSELGKVLFVLAIAGFLVGRAGRVTRWRTLWSAVGLGAAPILLVFLQPDLGTALVYSAAMFAVLFFVGVRWRHLLALVLAGVFALLAVLWLLPSAGVQVLKPYQAARLTAFADRSADVSDEGYNLAQSITAIGSGGLTGRSVVEASQTLLDYLPEHATDFVFASIAEQRGFLGASALLLLYLLVLWRGMRIVSIAPDGFTTVVAGGIVVALLFQTFVNVGMTMGIAPITGIPLPFVSVGGSSMISNLIAMGVLLAIAARGREAARR